MHFNMFFGDCREYRPYCASFVVGGGSRWTPILFSNMNRNTSDSESAYCNIPRDGIIKLCNFIHIIMIKWAVQSNN